MIGRPIRIASVLPRIAAERGILERMAVVYLITSALYPLLRPQVITDPGANLIRHAALALVIWFLPPWLRTRSAFVPRLLGTIYLPLLFPLLYSEMGRASLIFYDFRDSLDPAFIKAEGILFGCQPSLEWSRVWPWPWFHELMELAYFSYYFVSVTCLVLLLAGPGMASDQRWPAVRSFIRDLSATMLLCYTLYTFFPVWGPKYFETGPIPVSGGICTRIMLHIHENGAFLGAAFPSSHVAATVIPWWYVWKWLPRHRWWITTMLVSLSAATVYCRYHYVVDVIGGLGLAWAILYLGTRLDRRSAPIVKQTVE